ncbi:hypothetical protein [Halomonas mongoliensis]|uniref:hypothetical protein n=1 Tax=Halomonas mongoliensis TaxID=321265 RepID=UPI00403A9E88
MDDELKAIQADLESVLDRLAEYLSSDKLIFDEGIPAHPSDREDAARVALRYVATDGDTLEESIHYARYVRLQTVFPSSTRLGEPLPTGAPSELAELMEALGALESWLRNQWPLEDNHLETLALAVGAWSNKECEFIGESAGLSLTPKRQVDRRKLARESAAWEAFMLHKSDPQAHPVDEQLFEQIGKPYGMSARTVSRAYYAKKTRLWREAFERLLTSKTDLGQSTRKKLERFRLSRTDES